MYDNLTVGPKKEHDSQHIPVVAQLIGILIALTYSAWYSPLMQFVEHPLLKAAYISSKISPKSAW